MDIFKTLTELKPIQVLKIGGIIILALIVLSVSITMIGKSMRSLGNSVGVTSYAPSMGMDGGYAYEKGYASSDMPLGMPELSYRNVISDIYPTPYPQSPSGNDAEEFEVTEYSASIETGDRERTCATISDLKSRPYVIFENSNEYDRGCSYTFKVTRENVDQIIGIIKSLSPKELNENTYTIKRQIDDFTNEVEVLEKKRASIDATLESAIAAYDDITRVAKNSQNAEALAQIIDSRIRIIERLTQERISINEQLDRLARAKADQLDRLEYTYFHVSVSEIKFFDAEEIIDSWKESLKAFVQTANLIIQNLTINLIILFFFIFQFALYALIALLIVKYGWRIGKNIWNK